MRKTLSVCCSLSVHTSLSTYAPPPDAGKIYASSHNGTSPSSFFNTTQLKHIVTSDF